MTRLCESQERHQCLSWLTAWGELTPDEQTWTSPHLVWIGSRFHVGLRYKSRVQAMPWTTMHFEVVA